MEILNKLQQQFGNMVSLEELEPNLMRVYAPFFHEDGDMISMYLETTSDGNPCCLRDFGNTLMRVSYTFDLDSDNKRTILNNIVRSNHGIIEDHELQLPTSMDTISESILQFSQLVAKVSNIEILQRQVIKSLFFDYLNDYIMSEFPKFNVSKNATPSRDKQLVVDYRIASKTAAKPIYVFGVNENVKASKVVISCLNFQKQQIPFRSLVVHEDFDGLSSFYRNQVTNVVDKQYTSFDDFKEEGADYIARELAS